MKGLIIREPWIDLILDEKKTWEIRGSNTKIRGKIHLIKSGTGLIVGECELVDSFYADHDKMITNLSRHQLSYAQWLNLTYKSPHVWVMAEAIRYKEPIPYKHPQGAVIWVNEDD